VAEAIFDGHRLAREIDSENPAVQLPYRRERISLTSAVVP
jgi:dimethylamine/trimethylamine dehydrogenase